MIQRPTYVAVPSSRAPVGGPGTAAFTLIEMSIVLVIIGLIVGGVLVGQSLINAAAVRAQINQIEKYNTAVNTFRGKYNTLPGDISASLVKQFGFTVVAVRAGIQGQGDGNGVIEGANWSGSTIYGWNQGGETLWFWEDLSSNSSLIEGAFSAASNSSWGGTETNVAPFLPPAKIGNGNFIYVYSLNGTNWFALSTVPGIAGDGSFNPNPTPALTVAQAYNIDNKVDDGFPTTGNVLVRYPGGLCSGAFCAGAAPNAPSPTTCYDTTSKQYSITQNGGGGVNCGLSFKMQGGG